MILPFGGEDEAMLDGDAAEAESVKLGVAIGSVMISNQRWRVRGRKGSLDAKQRLKGDLLISYYKDVEMTLFVTINNKA